MYRIRCIGIVPDFVFGRILHDKIGRVADVLRYKAHDGSDIRLLLIPKNR